MSIGHLAWPISAEERARHEKQFHQLKPLNGLITGANGRQFFLKSGLPTQTLAIIWELADGNKDGMLDKTEFSVAMHLIQRKLQGHEITGATAPQLPQPPAPSLLGAAPSAYSNGMVQQQSLTSSSGLTNTTASIGTVPGVVEVFPSYVSAGGCPSLPFASLPPGLVMSSTSSSSVVTNNHSAGATSSLQSAADWSIPHESRLRYNQLFMALDKDRTGYLSGVQAKNVLLQTQLPHPVLAQIWNLSDIDSDGRLTLEEFSLATYLCEQYKCGHIPSLPTQIPPHLLPPSYRTPSKALVNGLGPGVMSNGTYNHPSQTTTPNLGRSTQGSSVESTTAQPAESQAKVKPPLTYEDRRKENFDRGFAILEQKRLAILAAETAERQARERKEVEEREKLDRQRQERERKQQHEIEMGKERQKEAERQADMEKIKLLQHKEGSRLELEKKRAEDVVASSLEELGAKLKRERAALAAFKITSSDLEAEVQNMGEKVSNMEQTLTDTKVVRDKLEESKGELDRKWEDARSLLSNMHREVENAKIRFQDLTYQRGKAQLAVNSNGNQGMSSSTQARKVALQSSIASLKSQLNDSSHLNDPSSTVAGKGWEDPFGLPASSPPQPPRVTPFQGADPFGHDAFNASPQPAPAPATAPISRPAQASVDKMTSGDVHPFSASIPRRSLQGPAEALAQELKDKIDLKRRGSGPDPFAPDPFVPVQSGNRNLVRITTPVNDSESAQAQVDPSGTSSDPKATKLCPYRALFQFDARSEDEISFKPDDIILVAEDETSEPGWLGGKIGDKVGWFPAAYAHKVSKATTPTNPPTAVVRQVSIPFLSLGNIPEETASSGDSSSHIYQELSEIKKAKGLGREEGPLAAAAVGEPELAGPPTEVKAVAMYPLQSTTEGDLSFAQGDIMTITQEPDANWWIATMGGKTGYVPKPYVKVLSDPNSSRPSSTPAIRPPPAATNQATAFPSSTGNFSRSEAATPTGDRRNSLNQSASPPTTRDIDAPPRKSSGADSWAAFDSAFATSSTPTAAGPSDPLSQQGSDHQGLRYVAIYPYSSTEVGDLNFKTGDVILINHEARDNSDPDWWTGSLLSTGAKGTFPSNYVTKMAPPVEEVNNVTVAPLKLQHQRKSSTGSVGSSTSFKSGSVKRAAGPLETVVAIAPFTASGPEQISLTPGLVMQVRRKTPTGWWEGEVVPPKAGQAGITTKKEVGWFPGSHVKPLKSTSLNDPDRKPGSAWSKPSPINAPGPPGLPSPAQQPVVYTVKALFDYASNHAGDLSFKQGHLIHVTEKNDANWWTGRSASTNQTGLFPSNYVSAVSVSSYDPSQAPAPS